MTARPVNTKPQGIGVGVMRLLIVDDQPSLRQAIRMRLAAEADLSVIGEAPDGEAALEQAVSLCPDIVLMDVEMPHMDGIAATCVLRRVCPQTSVITLSIHDDPLTQSRARDAGAAAFVSKSMPAETLLKTVRQVARMSSWAKGDRSLAEQNVDR